ncbi:MAG: DHH family phosphoesterase [Candidatus Thermoplasmatota archaeon]
MGEEGNLFDIPDELEKKLERAISILDEYDKFRLITHYDADGISASAVLARTVMKYQKGFHTTFIDSFPEKIPSGYPIIFTDIGNSHLERISELEEDVIVLDHHEVRNDPNSPGGGNKVFINPHDHGWDGSQEVSGGTLALLLAVSYDSNNWEEAVYGLAGAAADKQAIGGFTGLNLKLMERSVEEDYLEKRTGLFIDGENVSTALMKACDPYFPGISGEKSEIKKILEDLNIDLGAKLESINVEKKRKLNSLLALSLLKRDIPPDVIEAIYGTHLVSAHDDLEIDILYKILNSCARNDRPGLGLSVCLGDEKAYEEAKEIRDGHRKRMIEKLKTLEERIEKRKNIQHFYEEKKTMKGELAGLGMLYVLDQNMPVLGLTEGDEKIDISARATKNMVEKGLDMGGLCERLAGEFNGDGGGHDIAAGAKIEKDNIDDFLKMMDEEVGKIL